jgi:nitroreductase/NAD-dependent dihydropyrimidine dehydrogenase PreA subunit
MIWIDENRCTLCGLCARVCLRGVLEEREKGVAVIDPALCNLCGHCKAICPTNAPRLSNFSEAEFEPSPNMDEFPSPAAFLRFLRRRRSQRIYKSKPVETEKLKMITEAGRFAPTGGNRQGCEYTVARGKNTLGRVCTLALQTLQEQGKLVKEALDRYHRSKEPLPEEYATMQYYPSLFIDRMAEKWEVGEDQLLYHAPVLILIHMKQGLTANPQVDASLSALHMILMAETLGLGTCIIGFLLFAITHSAELREVLEIPSDHQVHVAFTVGYSDVEFLRLVARNPAKTKWIDDSPGKNPTPR